MPPAPACTSTNAFAGEHATEFEILDAARVPIDIGDDCVGSLFVLLGFGEVEQLVGAVEAVVDAADAADDLVEPGALLAQRLRAFGHVPYVGIFHLPIHFFEAFDLAVEVKDTP